MFVLIYVDSGTGFCLRKSTSCKELICFVIGLLVTCENVQVFAVMNMPLNFTAICQCVCSCEIVFWKNGGVCGEISEWIYF